MGHHHSHDHQCAHHQHAQASTHGAGHQHHPAPNQHNRRAFQIAIALNASFVIVEFAYGFIANSTALLADAGHNLSDVLGLLLAWGATLLAKQPPTTRYTYGLRSSSILAAITNAFFLLVACGGIAWEAVQRFAAPPAVASWTVMLVAAMGIVINGLSAWLFVKGSQTDLNIRAAYLHMAADAAVSFGVVLAGLVMLFTGWYWLDPVISLIIVVTIIIGTWQVLREALQLALAAVPSYIDLAAVQDFLLQQPGVVSVHDLHIWALSTTESALTVHLVMPAGYPGDTFTDELSQLLSTRFAIAHSTLQIEQGTIQHTCMLQQPATGVKHGHQH